MDFCSTTSASTFPCFQITWMANQNFPCLIRYQCLINLIVSSQVTTLHLDGQGISKLSNLEKLTHLRWASFSENNINRVEVLYNWFELGCLAEGVPVRLFAIFLSSMHLKSWIGRDDEW